MAKHYTDEELKSIDEEFCRLLAEKGWRYLIVDSSLAFRKTLANTLIKAGAEELLEAKDGMEAIMLLKKAPAGIVTITELNLPVMDGLALLRKVREDEQLAQGPVIIMSAETRKDRIVAAIRGGAAAYLKKPFPPEVLIAKLKELKVI